QAMRIQGLFAAEMAERILKEVRLDGVLFVEPIGGNDRPLLSPDQYEDFVLPTYEPALRVLHRHGVENIIFLTFANTRVLLPAVLGRGFNCLWACEVNREAMDYRALRREFGRKLRLIGGIDLDALRRGKESIRREMQQTLPPLLAEGGYIPLADGRVREEISLDNYTYYRRLLEELTT
ncbi:MAG: hypothetical protein JW821_20610, partial [Deltaproteobacteria bacterium]|nr:hypothetical protein [Deltaproteobacteria bacterium]